MRIPPRHAVIHLPALSGDEALLLLRILDRLHDAIWRAHGDDIERCLEERAPAASAPPPAPMLADDDLPF
ncbi:hypothetical protein [Haliangium sp.]|uniref:hypothetical protein n=1 Tax=Haliangium sp. TaxID=2663208 RepID=UPI003D0F0F0D